MPSSWSPSLRFELQFTGENVNLWGERLNGALQRADSAIAGWSTIALAGDYVLSTANGGPDEARSAMLKFTGAGGTVIIPSVSKQYLVWNACTGPVTMTTGGGAVVVLDPGDKVPVFSDGTGVYQPGYAGLGLKEYIASAVIGTTGSLPAVTGNAGKYIYTDGATSYWKRPTTADLGDYSTTVLGVQVALSAAL